ncbi:UDP-D-apiose/UDP-D-xylose synthase [Ananas comosus]|uniref:UDP-D-apiose/UDP-D-xylose synthase n=1 Tax=Ananas comosus TaxID=4615 RepID=A0A199UWI3_ANACO|nr:UDP-D-apiose/UDP-D-xylose synthase [Ananas comosus]
MRHQFVRVPVEHFRKTTRANQRCAEEVVSAVLFGVWVASVDDSLPREDAVTHLTSFVSRLLVLAVDIYSYKIKNLLEPQPEHGWIQFHRLNIKNGSQPEGVIKMTDLVKYWSENSKRLIHFSTREVLGRLLEAFSQRITLCDR